MQYVDIAKVSTSKMLLKYLKKVSCNKLPFIIIFISDNDKELKKKLSDTRDICTSTLDFMKTEQMNLRLIEMKNGGKLLHEFIKVFFTSRITQKLLKDKNAVAHCEKASMLSRYTKNINDVDDLFVDVAAKNYWKNKFKAEFIENELAKAVNVLSEAS